MQAPKDKKGLQSFQSMVNNYYYLKCCSAQLTRLFQLFKPLLQEDMEWSWDSSHKKALCFNPKAVHVIQKDASRKGLVAVLLQEERPVVYVSRTLTPAEERYSNIKRELLGVVFAMERLHHYVYGEPV